MPGLTHRSMTALRPARAILRAAWLMARSWLGYSMATIVLWLAISATAIVPLIEWLFGRALLGAGIPNVTDRTLARLLTSPTADLYLIAIAALAYATVSAQFATLVAISRGAHAAQALSLKRSFGDVGAGLRKTLKPSAPLLALYLFVVMPLGGLGMMSPLTSGIAVPPFVTREYLKDPLSAALYVAFVAALLYANARLIYTLPAVLAGRLTPLEAVRLSLRLSRRRALYLAGMLALPAGLGYLLSSGVIEAVVLLVGNVSSEAKVAVLVGAGRFFALAALVVAGCTALNVAVGDVAGALQDPRRPQPRAGGAPAPRRRRGVRSRLTQATALAASFAVVAAGGTFWGPAAVALPSHGAQDAVVLAHRGAVWGGVENTLGALRAAAAEGADTVEMDVQQSADGVFVASHDSNLLIMAGVNRNIYDMSAAEITSTVVRQHGFEDTIPTLREYVSLAHRLGMHLLIELKVTGHESGDVVTDFLAELEGLGYTDDADYHSLDPDAVRALKERRPELRVGLTIALSAGRVPVTPADFFVVEQASFSARFLEEAHAQSKPVYVWTVNDDATLRALLSLPVDGVVTDRVPNALRLRSELSSGVDPGSVARDALNGLDLFRR